MSAKHDSVAITIDPADPNTAAETSAGLVQILSFGLDYHSVIDSRFMNIPFLLSGLFDSKGKNCDCSCRGCNGCG